MNQSYAFWDLVAQEAYLPQNGILQNHRLDDFSKRNADGKVWLFGCNDACRECIKQFKDKWNIAGILDNSVAMQGKKFEGVRVCTPSDIVPNLNAEERDAVVLSLRLNADIVAKQIIEMGFSNLYSLGVLLSDMEPFSSFIADVDILKNEPLQDIVLLESTNDIDGNSGALYEYLRKRGTAHKFVWVVKKTVDNDKLLSVEDEAICLNDVDSLKRYVRYRAISKWQIWECDPIRKVRSEQINVFLQHYGMGYKQVAHLYNSPGYVDYALTTNAFVHEMEKTSITYGKNTKFIYGELPRNDVLISEKWNELEKLTDKKFKKVVMWAPTLRESAYYHRVDSDIDYPYGISLIYEENDMQRLNDILYDLDILLIIKIHPRQKINFKEKEFSNILYIDGQSVKKLHSYKLLTQMDAMITDYSSIVFDYMLLDRPIAWVLEDREHYKIEYLMDNPMEYMPGEKIFYLKDLERFLKDVSEGKDRYRKERRIICDRCNPCLEGKGCEKLAEALRL